MLYIPEKQGQPGIQGQTRRSVYTLGDEVGCRTAAVLQSRKGGHKSENKVLGQKLDVLFQCTWTFHFDATNRSISQGRPLTSVRIVHLFLTHKGLFNEIIGLFLRFKVLIKYHLRIIPRVTTKIQKCQII